MYVRINKCGILLIHTRMDKCRMSGYCLWTHSGCPDIAHIHTNGQMQDARILLVDKFRMSGYCSWTNAECPDIAHAHTLNRILVGAADFVHLCGKLFQGGECIMVSSRERRFEPLIDWYLFYDVGPKTNYQLMYFHCILHQTVISIACFIPIQNYNICQFCIWKINMGLQKVW